jgi:hypothetical protein
MNDITDKSGFQFTREGSITTGTLQDIGTPIIMQVCEDAIVIEVFNDNGSALSDFAIYIRPHKDADWHLYINGNDWSTKHNEVLRHMESDPSTLGSGEKTSLYIKVGSSACIKFGASAATGPTHVTVLGTCGVD